MNLSSDFIHQVLDSTTEIIASYDTDLRIKWCNESGLKQAGKPLSEIQGHHCWEVWKNRNEPCENCPVLRTKETGKPDEGEIETSDHHYWHVRSFGIFDDNGNLIGITEFGRDITRRKHLETIAQEKENDLKLALDSILDSFFIFRAIRDENNKIIDFVFVHANKNSAKMLQMTPEFLVGKRMCELLPVNRENGFFEKYVKVVETGIPLEEEFYLPETHVPAAWHYHQVVKMGDGIAIYHQDISENKQAQEKISVLAEMVDHAPNSITVHDIEGRFLYANSKTYEIHGYSAEEFMNLNLHDLDVPESSELIEERIGLIMETGEAAFEAGHYRKDGSTFPVQVLVKRINWLGTPAMMSIATDITERKKYLETLKYSEEKFSTAFMTSPYAILITRAEDGRIYEVNDTFCNKTGWVREDAIGHSVLDLNLYETSDDRDYILGKLQQTGQITDEEFRFRIKDGTLINSLFSGRIIKIGDQTLILSSINDITAYKKALSDREKLEKQLAQSQKMEAIGTLAGGISHDFNNLLQGIGGYTQLMLMEKSPEDPDYSSLKSIQSAAQRAGELVRQLLLFSRKAESVKKNLRLCEEVVSARKLLERTLPKMISIKTLCGGNIRSVFADPVQIEQVILNLATNASHAMPDGGELTFSVENCELEESKLPDNVDARSGQFVCMKVFDTGCGMDAETLSKIFEPFFTTKEAGKGTGLGLASVFGIVKGHGGWIMVTSEVGKGTEFSVYLPASSEKTSSQTGKYEVPAPGGHETIMVVDDEELIVKFASRTLQKFGYTVHSANSGEKAVEIFKEKCQEINLIVLDISMPGIGGLACLKELRSINPNVRVIVASGYAASNVAQECTQMGASYLSKPYQLNELLKIVREILDRKS
ncbi:PAS domain S-box protein [Myxococcota bacterium]|nr:PAS domain S-box protein [Myxococcota bacterium]MBU1380878.1 PAS domain S-box protein [Myxococcota bacterium]MBU1497006.1 PAS domain S-box protein [Myxococcota bacterium]